MRVICYRNLHRGDWTVAALTGRTSCGKVIGHHASVTLTDVTFYVCQSMRDKVVARQRRKVHAWAIGTLVEDKTPPAGAVSLTYNPYVADHFQQRCDGAPVHRADAVHFTPAHGAVAINPGV